MLLLYLQMEKVSNSDNDYDESFELETPSLERLEEMVSERAEMMDNIDKQVIFYRGELHTPSEKRTNFCSIVSGLPIITCVKLSFFL